MNLNIIELLKMLQLMYAIRNSSDDNTQLAV